MRIVVLRKVLACGVSRALLVFTNNLNATEKSDLVTQFPYALKARLKDLTLNDYPFLPVVNAEIIGSMEVQVTVEGAERRVGGVVNSPNTDPKRIALTISI